MIKKQECFFFSNLEVRLLDFLQQVIKDVDMLITACM